MDIFCLILHAQTSYRNISKSRLTLSKYNTTYLRVIAFIDFYVTLNQTAQVFLRGTPGRLVGRFVVFKQNNYILCQRGCRFIVCNNSQRFDCEPLITLDQ